MGLIRSNDSRRCPCANRPRSRAVDTKAKVGDRDSDPDRRGDALRQAGDPSERSDRGAELAAEHAPVATGMPRGAVMLAVVMRGSCLRMTKGEGGRLRCGRWRYRKHELQRQGHRGHQRHHAPRHLLPPVHGAFPSISCKRFAVCFGLVQSSLFYRKLKFYGGCRGAFFPKIFLRIDPVPLPLVDWCFAEVFGPSIDKRCL